MRSKFERRIAKNLKERGVKFEYEQYSYEYDEPLRKNRSFCGTCGSTELYRTGWYTPDFFLSNGVIIEAKGRFTVYDRRKQLAVREAHPDLNIKLLFMTDNKIHKRSETRYSDWCEQHGFDYAFKEVPDQWLTKTQS